MLLTIIVLVILLIAHTLLVCLNDKLKTKTKIIITPFALIIEILISIIIGNLFNPPNGNPDNSSCEMTTKIIIPSTTQKEAIITQDITTNLQEPSTSTASPYSATTTEVEKRLKLTYEIIPLPLTDKNAIIHADTSFEAEKVLLKCEVNNEFYASWKFNTKDSKHWWFDANFFEDNDYVLTAIAYSSTGETVTDSIIISYPFK